MSRLTWIPLLALLALSCDVPDAPTSELRAEAAARRPSPGVARKPSPPDPLSHPHSLPPGRGGNQTPAPADRPLVVFLGDSLTAGMGLEQEHAFPARVAERLAGLGLPIRVVNAGVSGDTSAGGLRRLDWLLRQEPDVLVVGLGANDGLRGLPLEETERNLDEIVRRARAAGTQVLLLGMKIPPNYGPEYAGGFESLYPRLARELDVPLVPFLLEGVGGEPDLNLPDGLHPNVLGQERVAGNVVPYLREMVTALPEQGQGG